MLKTSFKKLGKKCLIDIPPVIEIIIIKINDHGNITYSPINRHSTIVNIVMENNIQKDL